jgi:hypothetical protein
MKSYLLLFPAQRAARPAELQAADRLSEQSAQQPAEGKEQTQKSYFKK